MTESLTNIDKLVTSFFELFDNRRNRVPNYDLFKEHFVEDSVIGYRTEAGVTIWPLHEFWEPREELLTGGRLADFHEWEVDSETSISNGIASRRSSYQKEGLLDGLPYTGKGTKIFQLALVPDGWRIAYLLWEDQA